MRAIPWLGRWLILTTVTMWLSWSHKILLIGDSNDRNIVIDWCNTMFSKESSYELWAKGDSRFRSVRCLYRNHSFHNIFIFGSDELASSWGENGEDLKHYTKDLLPTRIHQYFEEVGAPDVIFFQSIIWDVAQFYRRLPGAKSNQPLVLPLSEWNTTIATYTNNIQRRIDDIRRYVQQELISFNISPAHSIHYGIRSSVIHSEMKPITPKFNRVLMRIAAERNFTLYDLHDHVWSVFRHNYTVERCALRDGLHPHTVFLRVAGDAILGHHYTTSMLRRGSSFPVDLCLFFSDSFSSAPSSSATTSLRSSRYYCPRPYKEILAKIQRVHLVSVKQKGVDSHLSRANEDDDLRTVFYLYYAADGIHRLGPLSIAQARHLNFSPRDILYLSQEELDAIPLSTKYRTPFDNSSPSSSSSLNAFRVFKTNNGRVFLFYPPERTIRPFSMSLQHLRNYGLTVENSTSSSGEWTCKEMVENVLSEVVALLLEYPPVPAIFENGRIFQFGKSNIRPMYMFINGQKCVFQKHMLAALDLHQGMILQVERVDLDALPTGPSVQESDLPLLRKEIAARSAKTMQRSIAGDGSGVLGEKRKFRQSKRQPPPQQQQQSTQQQQQPMQQQQQPPQQSPRPQSRQKTSDNVQYRHHQHQQKHHYSPSHHNQQNRKDLLVPSRQRGQRQT